MSPVNEIERFIEGYSSSSTVSPKVQFHLMSPICPLYVVLNPKAGCPFHPKMASSNFWGIDASSRMSTGRSAMLHKSGCTTHGTELNVMPTVSSGFVQCNDSGRRNLSRWLP